jgi:hypothetical protein
MKAKVRSLGDLGPLAARMFAPGDGEQPVRHRSALVDAVNGDGTVDLDVQGVIIANVAVLAGATAGVGDVVHVLVWPGDMLVVGAVA